MCARTTPFATRALAAASLSGTCVVVANPRDPVQALRQRSVVATGIPWCSSHSLTRKTVNMHVVQCARVYEGTYTAELSLMGRKYASSLPFIIGRQSLTTGLTRLIVVLSGVLRCRCRARYLHGARILKCRTARTVVSACRLQCVRARLALYQTDKLCATIQALFSACLQAASQCCECTLAEPLPTSSLFFVHSH